MLKTITVFTMLDSWIRQFTRAHFFLVSLLLVCLTLVQYGVGIVPREFYRAVASNPYMEQKEVHEENYFQESPLLPIVAHHLGFVSRLSFNLFCLTVIIGAYGLFACLIRDQMDRSLACIVFALLQAHPVTTVLLAWLGMPDCITFAMTTLVLFTSSLVGLALLCILGAFNHPVVIFAIPAILVLRRLAKDKGITWWHPAVSVIALGVGVLTIHGFLYLFDINIYSRLSHATAIDLNFWIKHNLPFLPMTLFSFHSIIWLSIGICILAAFRFNRLYFIVFALTQISFYAITFFSLDTTRVFALLAWAPAIHCIIYSCRLLRDQQQDVLYEQTQKLLLLVALIGILIPNYYVYLGNVYHPSGNEFQIWSYLQSLLR